MHWNQNWRTLFIGDYQDQSPAGHSPVCTPAHWLQWLFNYTNFFVCFRRAPNGGHVGPRWRHDDCGGGTQILWIWRVGEERGRGRCGHGQTQLQTCLGTGGWPHCVTGHVAAPGKHHHCCYNKTYKQREGWGRPDYSGISTEICLSRVTTTAGSTSWPPSCRGEGWRNNGQARDSSRLDKCSPITRDRIIWIRNFVSTPSMALQDTLTHADSRFL